MNELIPIQTNTIDGEPRQTVNARELWEKLESKRDFSTWIKDRIKKYGFIGNQDYTLTKIVERVNGNNGGGTVAKKEYYLTIDTAKELAMVENNEQGRRIRKYFIEIEKKYHNPALFSKKELLQIAVSEIERLESTLRETEPKVEAYNDLMATDNTYSVNEAAKILGIGPNKLYAKLRKEGLIYHYPYVLYIEDRQSLTHINLPYQKYVDAGLFIERMVIKYISRTKNSIPQVRITAKGIEYLRRKFKLAA